MKKRGLTLVEIMVVVGIAGFLLSVAMVYFGKHRLEQIAVKSADMLMENFHKQIARAEALNAHKEGGVDTSCGIIFNNNHSFSLYEYGNTSSPTSTVDPAKNFGSLPVIFTLVPDAGYSNSRISFYADKTSSDNWTGRVDVQCGNSKVKSVYIETGGRIDVR